MRSQGLALNAFPDTTPAILMQNASLASANNSFRERKEPEQGQVSETVCFQARTSLVLLQTAANGPARRASPLSLPPHPLCSAWHLQAGHLPWPAHSTAAALFHSAGCPMMCVKETGGLCLPIVWPQPLLCRARDLPTFPCLRAAVVLQPASRGFKVYRTAKCRVFSRSGGSLPFWGRASGLCLAHGRAEGAVGEGEPAPGPAERSLQLRPAGLGARPGTRRWREAGKGGRRRHSPA